MEPYATLSTTDGGSVSTPGHVNIGHPYYAGATVNISGGASLSIATAHITGSLNNSVTAGYTHGASDRYDAIDVNGPLSVGGTLTVSVSGGYTPSGPATFDLFNFTSFGGSLAQVNLPVVAGHTWNTAQLSLDGTISPVASAIPEPSAFAALAGLACAAAVLVRRHRSSGSGTFAPAPYPVPVHPRCFARSSRSVRFVAASFPIMFAR